MKQTKKKGEVTRGCSGWGVAKYAAYVLSGKRFSAPEAGSETKQRQPVLSLFISFSLSLAHTLPISLQPTVSQVTAVFATHL